MWRLEQWLSHSEATQSQLHSSPKSMEKLEEAAQDHRVKIFCCIYLLSFL